MSWTPDAPNPCVPVRLRDTCRLYATWSFANRCHAHCDYCFADPKHQGFPRWWSEAQAVAAWRNVAAIHGPCYLLLGGLEPGEELPLIGEVLRHHWGSMSTNFTFDLDELQQRIPPDRLILHPTFHPHLWGYDPTEFMAKVAAAKAAGYEVPLVALVGAPQALPRWDEWVLRLRALGVYVNAVPMRDASYRGVAYPEGYTDEERAILARHTNQAKYDATGRVAARPLRACAAGLATVCVTYDGRVLRCAQVPGMGEQNLMRDGNLQLLPEPMPCPRARCECLNLHGFHIMENGEE